MPTIPPGARMTDLAPRANAARQTGFLSRLSTAVRYAIAGVAPDGWMSPGQPIQPVAQETAGRRYDFPVAANLIYTPRAGELTSFQQLRALADNCDLVRLAIETRKDQMAAMKWNIVNVDEDKHGVTDPRIDAVLAMMQRPSGHHGWQTWLRMLLEEVMVTDAPAIYPRRANNGAAIAFEVIDGATINILIDEGGRLPIPPSPAYQQVLKGLPASDLTTDELIYIQRNPRASKLYGFSPVEQIILTVNIALRRTASQLQYFTEGNIPAAFASVPTDWSGQQIKEFQAYWDSVIEGDQGYKRKMRFVPGDTKVTNVRNAPLADEFDEWLARVICYAFSLPPTQFVKQATRTTSDALQEAALKEGLAPLTLWVKEVVDHLIQRVLGFPDLTFTWVEEEALDPQSQQVILTNLQKQGIYSINEVREKLGEDPIDGDGGDAYLIFTGTGAVTLDSVINPPDPPPVIVHPGLPGAAKPDVPPDGARPGAPKPDPVKKAAAHSHKPDDSPLTPAMQTLADGFTVALAEVRDAAVKRAGGLGKAAGSSDDGSSQHDASWWDAFAAELDTSGLSLVWDDYNDTLVAVSADGAREEVARIIVADPSAQPAATAAGFDMLDHQDPRAIEWATEHAAEMLTKDGAGGQLADSTRNMIRQVIANALDDKATRSQIATRLQESYAFSKQRAELIAQTEVRNAQGMGGLMGGLAVGMKVKKWLLSNDEGVCPACEANAAQGWIAIGEKFISGASAPLQHPKCRCDAAYRRKPIEG